MFALQSGLIDSNSCARVAANFHKMQCRTMQCVKSVLPVSGGQGTAKRCFVPRAAASQEWNNPSKISREHKRVRRGAICSPEQDKEDAHLSILSVQGSMEGGEATVLTGTRTGIKIMSEWEAGQGSIMYIALLKQGTLYIGVDPSATQIRPGNGGLRIRSYPTPTAARMEALKLSEAMTFKHGVYNTGFTGAKLVFDARVPIDEVDRSNLMDEIAEVLEVGPRRYFRVVECGVGQLSKPFVLRRRLWVLVCTRAVTSIQTRKTCFT